MTGMMEMDSILSNITIKTITNKTTTKETQLHTTIKTTIPIQMGLVKGIHPFIKTKCVLKKEEILRGWVGTRLAIQMMLSWIGLMEGAQVKMYSHKEVKMDTPMVVLMGIIMIRFKSRIMTL